ncbi:uncharacterized protein LOC135393150 [Ornithodoros turicata]|uniref:uncharacterized protein LOC135393150 n=1 Tax=Ornithodoros turicata TaxID=34597 RepID=UPI003138E819
MCIGKDEVRKLSHKGHCLPQPPYSVFHPKTLVHTSTQHIEFLDTERGGKHLLFDGYIYRISKKVNMSSYYKCLRGCRATVVLFDGVYSSYRGDHDHASQEARAASYRHTASLKDAVRRQPTTPVLQLYKEETSRFVDNIQAAAGMPSFTAVRSVLYRTRNEYLPALPPSRSEVNLQDRWRRTLDDANFLLVDDGTEDKILIFSTQANLQKLCRTNTIFIDGTFKVTPRLFAQLYTVHAEYLGAIFPFVYALLPDKSRLSYRRLFWHIKHAAGVYGYEFNPERVVCDYEAAAIRAVNDVFPRAEVKGCFFHYFQCIWRKVQSLGLVASYKESAQAGEWIRRCAALPFIPLPFVDEVYMWIQEQSPELPQAQAFHDYMVDTWVDEGAMFPRAIWNHFDNGSRRTINDVEGWHYRLNSASHISHGNIYKLAELIPKNQQVNEREQVMLQTGHVVPPPRRRYRVLNSRINVLKAQLTDGLRTFHQYIDAIAYAIHLE